jgi:hypothetical protein
VATGIPANPKICVADPDLEQTTRDSENSGEWRVLQEKAQGKTRMTCPSGGQSDGTEQAEQTEQQNRSGDRETELSKQHDQPEHTEQ